MSFLINIPDRPLDKLLERLHKDIDKQEIQVWPNVEAPEKVRFALVWKHHSGSLSPFENLEGISSFGAGVDSILADKALPQVDIARIVDPDLAHNMAMYVVTQIQQHRLRLNQFQSQQKQALWKPKSPHRNKRVGVLGLGELGASVSRWLVNMGFDVFGWSNSPKQITGVTPLVGKEGFDQVVAQADYLVNLLPLTPETKGILNSDTFNKMPQGSVVINVARGEHLIDADLIDALDNGHLDFAYLDVFRQEPLPPEHPFWPHQNIQITPHVSAVTNVATAVTQVVENYKNVMAGRPMVNTIDLNKGY